MHTIMYDNDIHLDKDMYDNDIHLDKDNHNLFCIILDVVLKHTIKMLY